MPATATRKPRVAKAKSNDLPQSVVDVIGYKKLGEVITWHAGGGASYLPTLHALAAEGLRDTVCRAMLPKQAFGRAAKKMVEDRVIDVAQEDGNEVVFQFTKKFQDQGEWVYTTDCVLRLDKATGKVTCRANPELERKAQEEVDRAIEHRTSGDISRMVQKLFEAEADLFPVREQGGVYFVPDEHTAFTTKIEAFLGRLGGRVARFPVPAGTQAGDRSVADAVAGGLDAMLTEQTEAVKDFGVTTRHDTLEAQAKRINEARLKVRAYAHYLGERSKELEAAADLADKKLAARVQELTAERIAHPPANGGGGNRAFIFSHSVTSVIRYLGKTGWSFRDTRRVVDHYCGEGLIADATLRAQLLAGRTGDRGVPAALTEEQYKAMVEIKFNKTA